MNVKNQAKSEETTLLRIVLATLLLVVGAIFCLGQYKDVALSTIGFVMTTSGFGWLQSMEGKMKVINRYFE